MHDEGVQLKMLQTALTLLQSPVHAHLEVRLRRPRAPRHAFSTAQVSTQLPRRGKMRVSDSCRGGPALQDSIRDVLSICFRLLGNTRNSDSVVSTASATVRQVSCSCNVELPTGS